MQTRQRKAEPTVKGEFPIAHVNGAVKHEASPAKPVVLSAALSVSSLVLYLLSSSYIILLNKRLMVDDGFKYPLTLTGLAQLAGAVAGQLPTPPSPSYKTGCDVLETKSGMSFEWYMRGPLSVAMQGGPFQKWESSSWVLHQPCASWSHACCLLF